MPVRILLLLVFLFPLSGLGQKDSSELIISLEYRPRFEFRNGYKKLPDDTTKAAAFVSQRARLTLAYERSKFRFKTSVQDIRVWGQYGLPSSPDGLGIFETYVEPKLGKYCSLRIGRQAVELDNGRLFARANWNQASKAHEGVNYIYNSKRLHAELMAFYNQSGEQLFGTQYDLSSTTYTMLGIHYLSWKALKWLNITTLNSVDCYQNTVAPEVMYVRATTGGRFTIKHKKFAFTNATWYQFGQLGTGQEISAFYFQPELSFRSRPVGIRLGMEYMSGDDGTANSAVSNSFSTLYGVAFRFMGNMNQFTRFPEDTGGAGLVNPYLFFRFRLLEQLNVKLESHLFYSQNNLVINNELQDAFLAAESDLKIKYVFNEYTTLESGLSYMIPTASLGALKGQPDYNNPVWMYVMVKFNPTLLRIKQPVK